MIIKSYVFLQIIYRLVENANNELEQHLPIICHDCVFDIIKKAS